MITATAWVPRGFAAPFPTKYEFNEEEFQRIADLARLQLDDANEDLEDARNGKGEDEENEDDAMDEGNGAQKEDEEEEDDDDEAEEGGKTLKSTA